MTDDLFDTTQRRRPGARRPPIIDQDGNEVRSGGFGSAGPFASGFDFQGMTGAFSGISFGPLTREQRFARIDALAKLLDVAFVLPGTNIRYGIDGLIGLVPIVGDLLTTGHLAMDRARGARSGRAKACSGADARQRRA